MNTDQGELSTTPDLCGVIGCARRWAHLIHADDLRPSLVEAIFGISLAPRDAPREERYQAWLAYQAGLRVCQDHLRKLRRQDGVTLGYRRVNGKLRAFVKDEYF